MQFQRNGYALLFCSRSLFARNLSTVRTSSIFETARFLMDFKASGDANTLYDSGVSNNVLNAVTNGNNLREALSGDHVASQSTGLAGCHQRAPYALSAAQRLDLKRGKAIITKLAVG